MIEELVLQRIPSRKGKHPQNVKFFVVVANTVSNKGLPCRLYKELISQ